MVEESDVVVLLLEGLDDFPEGGREGVRRAVPAAEDSRSQIAS